MLPINMPYTRCPTRLPVALAPDPEKRGIPIMGITMVCAIQTGEGPFGFPGVPGKSIHQELKAGDLDPPSAESGVGKPGRGSVVGG